MADDNFSYKILSTVSDGYELQVLLNPESLFNLSVQHRLSYPLRQGAFLSLWYFVFSNPQYKEVRKDRQFKHHLIYLDILNHCGRWPAPDQRSKPVKVCQNN